jgi:uracil-DNA glycosylase
VPKPDWPTAAAFLPAERDLEHLRAAAAECRGCPLHEHATQTVFGRGGPDARLALVGEQPGDVEDAQIDRADVYLTNAVKHFKFTVRGKRRIHATPDTWQVAACRPWLDAELQAVRPDLVVLLGATAAKCVYGSSFRVTQSRGVVLPWPVEGGPQAVATIHPSAVLRADDRGAALAGLVADLRVAAQALA